MQATLPKQANRSQVQLHMVTWCCTTGALPARAAHIHATWCSHTLDPDLRTWHQRPECTGAMHSMHDHC